MTNDRKSACDELSRVETGDWQRMWFRTNKVWVAVDAQGKPVTKDGKVLIKYQLKQDYEYWVKKNNVSPIDSPPPRTKLQKKGGTRNKKSANDKPTAASEPWDESAYIPVRLFTDSKYAYGLLELNWKPKKNRQLIDSIKKKMTGFKDLKIIKVKGHSGHPGNEKADYLATSAIKNEKR